MNRKFLEQLGLTEEQVEAVMSEHGKSTQDLQAKVSAAANQRRYQLPDRKSTRLNSSHITRSRMPSSA